MLETPVRRHLTTSVALLLFTALLLSPLSALGHHHECAEEESRCEACHVVVVNLTCRVLVVAPSVLEGTAPASAKTWASQVRHSTKPIRGPPATAKTS